MRRVVKGSLRLLLIISVGLALSAFAAQGSDDGVAANLAGSKCAANAIAWNMAINAFEQVEKSDPTEGAAWNERLNRSIELGEETLALCQKGEGGRQNPERLMEIRYLLASLYARRAYHNVFGGGDPKLSTSDINRLVLELDYGFNDNELIVFWRAFMYIMSDQIESGKKEMASIRAKHGDDYELVRRIDRLIATRKR